jgi:hypothetical protein
MGRNWALDSVKRGQICAMVALGCSRRTAALHVGCAVSTIRHTAMHDRQFREQLRDAERHAEIEPLKNLQTHAAKNWRAAAWLLERTLPNTYVRRRPGLLDYHEAVQHLQRVIDAMMSEIPEGKVKRRLYRRFAKQRDRLEKELKAAADPLRDGKRRRKAEPRPPVPDWMRRDRMKARAAARQSANSRTETLGPPPESAPNKT